MRKLSRKFTDDTEGKFCNVAAAVVGAAVVGGVASNMAAGSAADAQQSAADSANATSMAQYNQTRADNAPFLANGTAASNRLAQLLGLSSATSPQYQKATADYLANVRATVPGLSPDWQPEANGIQDWISKHPGQYDDTNSDYGSLNRTFTQADLAADVPYSVGMQFGLDQGTQGINRLAAANGNLNSGATLKALAKFGNDYGNQQAGAAQNRFTANQTNTYNRLAGVAGSGQTAANTVDASGAATANALSNTAIGLGNARGASAIAQGNALSNGASSISNYYQQQQLLNQLQNGGAGNYNGYVNNSAANGFGNTFTQNGYSTNQTYG